MNQLAALNETIRRAEDAGMPEMPGSPVGLAHLRQMATTAAANDFGDAKLGRWLGWAQCAVVAADIGLTLDDMMSLNTTHRPGPVILSNDDCTHFADDLYLILATSYRPELAIPEELLDPVAITDVRLGDIALLDGTAIAVAVGPGKAYYGGRLGDADTLPARPDFRGWHRPKNSEVPAIRLCTTTTPKKRPSY